MKVILAGVTGFVGGALVRQCIKDSRITSIIALSRRNLPSELTANSNKLKVLIQKDFLEYPDDVIDELAGAEACLWALGGKVEDFFDVQTAKTVSVDYTLAAANAFAVKLLPGLGGKDFRFIFCSGGMAERDMNKSLYFMKDTRRIKGEVENGLIAIAEKHPGFKTYIMRPGGIIAEDAGVVMAVVGALIPSVRVNALAAVMADVGINGGEQQTLENSDIVKNSAPLLKY